MVSKKEYESITNNNIKKNKLKKKAEEKSNINNINTKTNKKTDINHEKKKVLRKSVIYALHIENYLSTDPKRLKITGDSRKKNFIYRKGDIQIYKDNYFLSEIEDKQYEHEEFIDIIKSVGLTEIIEMLLNLIKEKENTIIISQRENNNLNTNNFKLNKDNMFLFSQNINLKKELVSLMNNSNNKNNITKIKNSNSLMFMNNLFF